MNGWNMNPVDPDSLIPGAVTLYRHFFPPYRAYPPIPVVGIDPSLVVELDEAVRGIVSIQHFIHFFFHELPFVKRPASMDQWSALKSGIFGFENIGVHFILKLCSVIKYLMLFILLLLSPSGNQECITASMIFEVFS